MDYEITRTSFEDTEQRLTQKNLLDRIVEAGREPVERDSLYNMVEAADVPVAAHEYAGQQANAGSLA
jgi:2-iminoacetate synthase ThiH